MLAELTFEELAAGLDAVAAEALDTAGVDRPPVDAFAVARTLGLTVAWDDVQRPRARYVRLAQRQREPRPTVLLRHDVRPERHHWALAHEVGEHLAQRAFARLGLDPCEETPRAREELASQLASRLLLPTAWLDAAGRACDWDLMDLKERFRTASHEAIARRMLQFAAPVIVTIYDNGRMTFRGANFARRPPAPTVVEHRVWQAAHATGRPREDAEFGLRVRAWPVHEPDWRREILRTEPPELADAIYEDE